MLVKLRFYVVRDKATEVASTAQPSDLMRKVVGTLKALGFNLIGGVNGRDHFHAAYPLARLEMNDSMNTVLRSLGAVQKTIARGDSRP